MSAELMTHIDRYKKTVASRYRMVRPDDISRIPSGPLWISPKIDGELWFAEITPEDARLVARNGRELPQQCALLKELQFVRERVTGYTVLAGELFDKQGSPRPRVGGVSAALGKNGDPDRLCWHAFDALVINGNEPPADFDERSAALCTITKEGEHTGVVPFTRAESRSDIRSEWTRWVENESAEGLVIRSADARIFKMKPQRTVDAVILAYTVRAGEEDLARSLLLGLFNDDSTFSIIGAVGSLGSEDSRRELGARLSTMECNSAFRHPSSEGGLYRFVRPELIVEITCLDIQTEDSSGAALSRFLLSYDESGWKALRRRPTVSLITPVFQRIRDDKSAASPADASTEQIVALLGQSLRERFGSLENADNDFSEDTEKTTPAEIIRREVWTKVTKGETGVRKLLVCRTNKETVDPEWPAWVVHMTDYSPTRKNPLERFVRFARNEEDVAAYVELMMEKYIKKGWNLVESTATPPPAQ